MYKNRNGAMRDLQILTMSSPRSASCAVVAALELKIQILFNLYHMMRESIGTEFLQIATVEEQQNFFLIEIWLRRSFVSSVSIITEASLP